MNAPGASGQTLGATSVRLIQVLLLECVPEAFAYLQEVLCEEEDFLLGNPPD